MSEQRSLNELIHDLRTQNEKIRYLLGETVNEYFRHYDPDSESIKILLDFNRYKIHCEMAWDYILNNSEDLKALEELLAGGNKTTTVSD